MQHNMIFVFVCEILVGLSAAAPHNTSGRERRFGPGPMGGPGGGSPFHSGGNMGGMMPGGFMGGMSGPSMGGPNGKGQGSSMFGHSGFSCIRHEIVCPKWCLVEDENGCRSCPCGPAGGMSAIAGGPSGGPMSMMSHGGGGAMPSMGGSHSECSSTRLCMRSCQGNYELGPVGYDGCQTCSCNTLTGGITSGSHTMSGASAGGGGGVSGGGHPGGMASGGGGGTGGGAISASSSSSGGSAAISSHTSITTYEKPVKECVATLLCTSTCTSGYKLGAHTSSGCRACSCSAGHEVSTTTIHYITQTVKQPTRSCTATSHCMKSCTSGYTMANTDGHGCPVCSCVHTYQPPIEIAVEPPPIDEITVGRPQVAYTLTCAPRSCRAGCSVGYKCGTDGCPTCDCVHPSVVGQTTLQVYVERPVQCLRPLSCPSSCELGYKCDSSGCPSCECVVRYIQTHHYSVQTCTHTLTCASTCRHGYNIVSSGSGTCGKCACKQPVIYAVQRPQPPKYEVVRCPSTSSCSAKCSHGYDVIRYENACPECKCKPAPVYYAITSGSSGCDNGCETSGSGTVYLTGGSTSSSGSSYYVSSGSAGGSYSSGSYSTGGGGGSTGTYIITGGGGGGGSAGSGTSGGYVSSGGGGGMSYQYAGEGCPALPPDCHPSCIKYDTPHCRRCTCETSYTRYGK